MTPNPYEPPQHSGYGPPAKPLPSDAREKLLAFLGGAVGVAGFAIVVGFHHVLLSALGCLPLAVGIGLAFHVARLRQARLRQDGLTGAPTPLRAAILAAWFAACMYVAYIHSFGILAVIAANLTIVLAIGWLGNPWRVRD